MCHIPVREDYKTDKQIFFPLTSFFQDERLLGAQRGTKGAAFSPLMVCNAMYAGHHLTDRCCLSLSHLFISLCRKGECIGFHYLCWLADLGSGSSQGLCCTHHNIEVAPACSPSELPKKFSLTQPGFKPMKI